jgi:type IV secretion system protein VirD4
MTANQWLMGSSVLLSYLSAFFSRETPLHPARFAYLHELTDLIRPTVEGTGLLLGESDFSQVLRVEATRTRRELGNLLVVAPTRGGKGLLAVSQLLTWPHSVVVNDIKGELFTQTAGYRSRLGPVFVIDPKGVGHRYDPLLAKHTEDALFSAATHLLFKPDEGEGAIFTQRAAGMLTQLFLAARKEAAPPLPYVRALLRSGLVHAAERLNALEPALATQLLDVALGKADLTDRFLLSSWSTLTARLRPLLTETVIRSLSGTDFTAEALMHSERPVTVYLRWPEQDLLALSPLVRLLWDSLIDALITTYDRHQGVNCHPVLLLLDEAGRTAIPHLQEAATTVVGRGISLWVAIQSLAQLTAIYGKARAESLQNNMDTQLYYRQASQETAEYLERALGYRSGFACSHSQRAGSETAQGQSEQAVPLMTAQDIKQMEDEAVLGFHRHLPPFRIKRMDWRAFSLLQQRRSIPPPPLSPLPALDTSPWPDKRLPTAETVRDEPDPSFGWRLDPALLRWGRPPPAVNGLRKSKPDED